MPIQAARLSRSRRKRKPSKLPSLEASEPPDQRSVKRALRAPSRSAKRNAHPRRAEARRGRHARRAEARRGRHARRAEARRGRYARRAEREEGATRAEPKREEGATGAERADKTRPESAEAERAGTGAAPQAKPDSARAGTASATGKVNIPQDKAAQIVETLSQTTGTTNVNVAMNISAISVGVAIPANVTLYPLTPEVVAWVPQFRGYDYVVAQGEVIIVEPSSRQVVEVITSTSGVAAQPGPAVQPGPVARIALTGAQQQLLIELIRGENLPPAPVADVADGVTIEQNVELVPMPQAVVAQVPAIERYRVVVTNNGRVALVDPELGWWLTSSNRPKDFQDKQKEGRRVSSSPPLTFAVASMPIPAMTTPRMPTYRYSTPSNTRISRMIKTPPRPPEG